jgi:hypothetical protein
MRFSDFKGKENVNVRVTLRFLDFLAVEIKTSVVGTILVEISTNWIFTMLGV